MADKILEKIAFEIYLSALEFYAMHLLILDDHRIFAQSLSALLVPLPQWDSVQVVYSPETALDLIKKQTIDFVITDLQMPQMSGIALTAKIKQHRPNIKVLMLSMVQEAAQIREAIQVGVSGFCFKDIEKEEFERALEIIIKGDLYLSPPVLRVLTLTPATVRNDEVMSDLSVLSGREIEVLKLIAQELNTNQIAQKLFVSVNTIETHRKNLMRKLGVKNALGLIKFALRNGLVD